MMQEGSNTFDYLKRKYETQWKAYVNHEFVRRMKEGTLQHEVFKYYLIQDSKYVKDMTKSLALASANALEDKVSSFLVKILLSKDRGKEVHERLMAKLGITEEEIENSRYSLVNFAYTRHLLLSSRSWETFIFAWTPCMVGYHEIGKAVLDSKDEIYKEWASFYASSDYEGRVRMVLKELNSITPNDHLERLFEDSVRLEALFWESAMRLDPTVFR